MRPLIIIGVAATFLCGLVIACVPRGESLEERRAVYREGFKAGAIKTADENKTAYAAARRAEDAIDLCHGKGGEWLTHQARCDR
ncbi:hypothetical protein [Agaricicola taiwanensis]|nr:hypothetical protein [Agaricicola taiwanensis]